ncbi:peptidase M19, renal dipeptidase [Alkaliphilus metalliredigens QYMF]|uniref:Peptidase M19, renal dipeptidase n=1 Tax=Alkaliphilus metalliredigens (strain QYMF) TaxID=293826 RepID=A6TPC9_ALKMQ|nr:membrane dipeptidase [Alkaliphilus metalliredigens]ABR48047.1 peptidase M19, renal dipeptidase [Alkaliphilus metalliredigens QYMF]
MKIFDGHTDIFTDVVDQFIEGEKRTLIEEHLPKLKEGEIVAGNFVFWDEPKYKDNSLERLQISLDIVDKVLQDSDQYFIKIEKEVDFHKAMDKNLLAIILGIEGLAPIKKDLDWIHRLHQYGVRTASLTWNEENQLATGLDGDVNRGLTQDGMFALKMMESVGILIDVSHLNEKSFWDVINYSSKPVIATHCNAYTLCKHKRNLKDDQIDAIKSMGGMIGVNAWPGFVDEKDPSVERVIDHIDHMIDRIGVDHVSFGFDFTDFLLPAPKKKNSIKRKPTERLLNACHAQNAIKVMRNRGYCENDIASIAYDNLKSFYSLNI